MTATAPTEDHPGHEHTDIDGRAILLGALGVLAGVGLVALSVAALTRTVAPAHRGPIQSEVSQATRLRSDLESERDGYRASKRNELTTYAWVDRERGIAQIPVDRAMQLLIAQPGPAETPP